MFFKHVNNTLVLLFRDILLWKVFPLSPQGGIRGGRPSPAYEISRGRSSGIYTLFITLRNVLRFWQLVVVLF